VKTALVTVARADDPLLAALRGIPNLLLHVVPDANMTTFALDDTGPQRRLFLRARARSLAPPDVPVAFRAAPVVYVGPVAAECDRALMASFRDQFVGAGLQGWLRRAVSGAGPETDGRVLPELLPEVTDPAQLPLAVAVLSELDHPEAEDLAHRFAAAGTTVAITRGARGSTLLVGDTRIEVPAAPAVEVDPTGAGDVFGVVLTLHLARGADARSAGAAAAEAAARVVEGPGLGRL
jgi:sugar/nucleoside kinase (ribokinase family)